MPNEIVLMKPMGALAGLAVSMTEDGLVQIGDIAMDSTTARALWARMGEVIEICERQDELQDWLRLRRWLDDCYGVGRLVAVFAVDSRGRQGKTAHRGRLRRENDTRASVRIGDFTTAILRPTTSGASWRGAVLDWRADPVQFIPRFDNSRRVAVGSEDVNKAPVVDDLTGRLLSGKTPLRIPA